MTYSIQTCPACNGARKTEFQDHMGRYVIQWCGRCGGSGEVITKREELK